jgi:hypothetical protein
MPQEREPSYSLAYKQRQKEKSVDKAISKPKVEGEWRGNFPGDQPGSTLDRNIVHPSERFFNKPEDYETKI